jgi:hypothetical protein
LSPNIAVWGDSITVPVSPNLQVLVPSRSVYDGSGIAQDSGQVAARAVSNANTRSWISIIWCGHNNVRLGTPGRVVSDIQFMVSQLAPANGNRFVIVSLMNEAVAAGVRGGAVWNTVTQINSQLQALYPANYIDIRAAVVAHYNPALAQDVQDFNNDLPPTSLRYDEIHFRQEGSAFVAGLLRDFIAAKGW